ncbi:MAG: hypothetical protein ACR2PG_06400, partial [Hyphomicrobiaceae bacterium]
IGLTLRVAVALPTFIAHVEISLPVLSVVCLPTPIARPRYETINDTKHQLISNTRRGRRLKKKRNVTDL